MIMFYEDSGFRSLFQFISCSLPDKKQKMRKCSDKYRQKRIAAGNRTCQLCGIDWQMCNKFNLRVEPTFRYGLLKIIDEPITAYLWSCGLSFTCYFPLK